MWHPTMPPTTSELWATVILTFFVLILDGYVCDVHFTFAKLRFGIDWVSGNCRRRSRRHLAGRLR